MKQSTGFYVIKMFILTLQAPTPENGQTHSNNSSQTFTPQDFLRTFDHFAAGYWKNIAVKENSVLNKARLNQN